MQKSDNIIKRLQEPTPKFFKRVMWIGIVIGSAGGALLALPDSINLPENLNTIAGYMVAVGAGASAVAKTTRE